MERVRFIHYKGREILYIDFSDISAEEITTLLPEAQQLIASRPEDSVLTLTNVRDARYTNGLTVALPNETRNMLLE